MWSSSPPDLNYRAPLVDNEGTWALGIGLWISSSALMHQGVSGWRMEASADDLEAGEDFLTAFTGTNWWGFLTHRNGINHRVLLRRAGAWIDVSNDVYRSANEYSGIVTASGEIVYVVFRNGKTLMYSNGGWTVLTGSWVTANGAFASGTDLYVAHSQGLQHFNGASWSEVAVFPVEVLSVGGTSQEGVWAVSPTSIYRVQGNSLAATPGVAPLGCKYGQLVTDGTDLVLVANWALCSANAIWKRSSGTWTTLANGPSVSYPDFRVQAGTVYVGGAGGAMLRLDNGVWTPLAKDSTWPVTRFIRGSSITNVFALNTGVSKLVGDRWETVVGSENFVVKTAWVAPDGTLFLVSSTAAEPFAVWRYDGQQWTRDLTRPAPSADPMDPGFLVGRSSSDVYLAYVASQSEVLHWNGNAWAAVPGVPLPNGARIQSIGIFGSAGLLVGYAGAGSGLLERDGGNWTDLGPAPIMLLQAGPPQDPSALGLIDFQAVKTTKIRTSAAWANWSLPTSDLSVNGIALISPTQLVARLTNNNATFPFGFGRSDGAMPWNVLWNWTVNQPGTSKPRDLWSDGRWVVATARFGGVQPSPSTDLYVGGDAIVRCDLGP